MNVKEVQRMNDKSIVHLYVHIPYCIKKCDYCYFKSFGIPYGNGIPQDYFTALLKEIKMLSQKPVILGSMYWGGGTPTMMSAEQVEMLAETVSENFEMTSDYEFCSEVRPGPETTQEKIKILKNYNIKRVSMGAQSMNPEILKLNGRYHSVSNFLKTYEMLQKEEIFCKNVDLMSGMVGDNIQSFLDSIQKLVELSPENISIYKLQLYNNSKLYKKARAEQLALTTNEEEAQMVREGYTYLLEHGYELSGNLGFRKSPKYSHTHNVKTWLGEDLIGVGLSAHSRVDGRIYKNHNNVKRYIETVNNGKFPIERAYAYSVYEDMLRHFIYGVKSTNYNLVYFKERFGMDASKIFGKEIKWMEDNGYIVVKEEVIHTTLTGTLYVDDIMRAVLPDELDNIIVGHRRR